MTAPVVFVVDDDAAIRDSLSCFLETADIPVETFHSAEAFLAALHPRQAGCLVLDVHMAGMGGPDLQAELARREVRLPIIFLSAHGDIPTTVRVIKAGAVDFLTKPVDGTLLLDRIEAALALNERERLEEAAMRAARARLETLTDREREILSLAVAGETNKRIADRLGISFRTVEVHRSRILRKTGTATLVELVQLVGTSGCSAIAATFPPDDGTDGSETS